MVLLSNSKYSVASKDLTASTNKRCGVKKQNIFMQFVLFACLVVTLLLAYIYLFQYLPSQERLLRRNIFDKLKVIAQLSKPALTKAITGKDDISLLSQIENIVKVDDVSTAYILDNNGKVVMHDKTNEWGAVYTDAVSRLAVSKKDNLVQSTKDGKG